MATGYGLGLPLLQFFNDTGGVAAGYSLYTYATGTSTPQVTYSDSGLTTPNANPIVLDSAGRAVIYLPTNTAYKFLLKNLSAVQIWSQDAISLVSVATPPAPAAVPTGAILPYGAASAPSGYLLCDGTAVSRTVYADLFAVIATTFGIGDGATTFNVPDMRQKFPLGKAASGTGSTLGGSGGSIDHTHTGPSHTHTVSGTTGTPSATTNAVQGGAGVTSPTDTHTHTFSATSGASGTGATGSNNPPFLSLTYIVKI